MKRIVLFIIPILFFISCATTTTVSHEMKYSKQIFPGRWLKKIAVPVENGQKKSVAIIQIYFPKKYKRGEEMKTLIALSSYSSNESEWARNSSITRLADKYNFVIVCPNMKKSLYELSFYDDTEYRWNVIPGGKFVGETLIKYLQNNFNLATSKSKTGIMGVTVGAHGALMVAAKYDCFGAAAGISGYYNPSLMTSSRMIASVYGKYNKHKNRWEKDDNVLSMAEGLSGVKVFLFHGMKSDAFTPGQSRLMAIKIKHLQKKSDSYHIKYKESKGGYYGWTFWKKQVPHVMEFFNANLK